MSDQADTINILNLADWNVADTSVFSYVKTPIQNKIFANNSTLIGKVLRESILHFADTLDDIDRSSCVLGNEFRTTRTHKYHLMNSADEKPSDETAVMEVTTFAPIAFDQIRTTVGVTKNDFRSAFSDNELVNFANTGRSGSQMFKTPDDMYLIKTCRDYEANYLLQVLSGLYLRYSHTPTLLSRYVGLYSIHVRSVFVSEIYFIVMLNNLPSVLHAHELFDLKGSSVSRHSHIGVPSKRIKALKDIDFRSFYPNGIRIPHEIHQKLRSTIESDACELRRMKITDCSLMLGIYQLDEQIEVDNQKESTTVPKPKPQLGLSALYSVKSVDKEATSNCDSDVNNKIQIPSNPDTWRKIIMKPLNLIHCPHEKTFADSKIATLGLGIPGVTHDGRRVLLYPTLIDCLQTFDQFKRIQNALQNIRDPTRSSSYSIIDPDNYEKRFIKFLFEKVFIDSQLTLDELLVAPNICDEPLLNDTNTDQSSISTECTSPCSSERFNYDNPDDSNEQDTQTGKVTQWLRFQPFKS